MNNKSFIEQGVKKAVAHARESGLKLGQIVAHPSDNLTYELIRVNGNTAVIGLTAKQSPTGEAIEKTFPLNELFDPNDAFRFALDAKSETIAQRFPGALVIRVGK